MKIGLVPVVAILLLTACGGSNRPTSPQTGGTGTQTTTRVITPTGNLAFGNVEAGQTASSSLTIANSGNATLTVNGLTFDIADPLWSEAFFASMTATTKETIRTVTPK